MARALIVACGGAYEPVVAVYDKLLTNGAVVPSLNLKLRLLRSILVVLCERASSVTGSTALTYSGAFWMDRTSVINQGVRDKIISLANRFVSGLLFLIGNLVGTGTMSRCKHSFCHILFHLLE